MGGLKIFTFLGGTTGFPLLGDRGESLFHWPKTYSFLLHEELPSPQVDFSHQKYIPLPLNKYFHAITQ